MGRKTVKMFDIKKYLVFAVMMCLLTEISQRATDGDDNSYCFIVYYCSYILHLTKA